MKVDKKIIFCRVKDSDMKAAVFVDLETMKRPKYLSGGTYKIKPPTSDSALYLTINSIEINGAIRPYEIFVNSRDPSHYQWVTALTRTISAVFRKGGEVGFIVDELKEVFDPTGGYFKDGKLINSLVADIGWCIEDYLYEIGFRTKEELSDRKQKILSSA